MKKDIPEKDRKKLRALKDSALNIAAERILQKAEELIGSRGADSHKYHLKLWKMIREEDQEISIMFDDFKRSTAILKLALLKKSGLLSADAFENLSEEPRKRIDLISSINR